MTPAPMPLLPQYREDAVTRLLCAHTHLDEDFAQEVLDEFTADRLKAIGLPLGINLVALVRHARAAQQRRRLRDGQLAVLLLTIVASVIAALASLGNGHRSAAAAFGLAAAFALVVAAVVVHRSGHSAWRAARGVYRGQEKPQDLAAPVEAATEDRLKALRLANVVPYDAHVEADNPFVGSGEKIKEDVWPSIDVGRPADAPGGGKLTLMPFDAVGLHTYMARGMGAVAGLEGLRARNRLYVRGLHVPSLGAQLLPDPLRRPLPRIDKQLVQAGVIRPGGGMRTYLSLEMVGSGGKYVVSMHLRARLTQNRLSWQVAAYVLPPVHIRFSHVAYLPLGGLEQWWALVRFTATSLRWMLLGAFGRMRRRRARSVRHERELRKIRREITKYHAAYDYGALDSLRERAADLDTMDFDERMDAQDAFQRLQQGVLIATEKFLIDHNVDTSDFDRAQKVINNQTYNIGNVNGPSNIGNQGNIAIGQQGHGQGPGGYAGGGGGAQQSPQAGGKTT
ncbi:hypothetical protein OG883_11050 [Streptomyces sp. NBC_01142]|uniref:hypothetical protein n=1 Tax=Streptomyces sp. NBC_01142 TaxID=2975865 RepID=UPI00224F1455|nr:hypothetical protein [Streptomyces sp. NBC_01142]MCX4820435.1 hypothetical protein [Streptomyces sp. NBC_01142]